MIDLPEENPVAFSFLIAYLYEDKFQPIQPAFDAMSKSSWMCMSRKLIRRSSATTKRKRERGRA